MNASRFVRVLSSCWLPALGVTRVHLSGHSVELVDLPGNQADKYRRGMLIEFKEGSRS